MALKKFVKTGLSAALVAGLGTTALFAADIKANIMMRGDMVRVQKDETSGNKEYGYLMNNPTDQKDNPGDGLIIEVDNGNAGAHIAMWYKTALNNGFDGNEYEDDNWNAHFRRTYIWFKPFDSLKLRLGYVGYDGHFKEKLDEWKVGSPFAIEERDWVKHPAYINCNDVEGWGFGFEYRPVEQLLINAGITPGKKGAVASSDMKDSASFYNEDGSGYTKTKVAPWGVGARYWWDKFEFQASFRDGGQNDNRDGTWRVLRFGAGFTNELTYSFIQPVFGFDYNTTDEKWEMNGMCLDMYSEINVSALKFYLHAPVTFRWGDADTDLNYMELNFKAEYNTGSHGNLDDVKPYIQLGSNQDDALWGETVTRVWVFKHMDNSFHLSYKLGLNFMVSGAEVDFGLKYDQLSKYHKNTYHKDYVVSIPFAVKIKNF